MKRTVSLQMLLMVPAMVMMAGSANDEKDGAPQLPRVSMTKLADTLTASVVEGGAVLTIASPSGIGGAKLTRVGETWPEPLVLAFTLRGLESLLLSNKNLVLKIAVASHGDHRCSQSLEQEGESLAVEAGDPFYAAVSVIGADGGREEGLRRAGGGFSVVVPRALLKEKTLEVKWVDFFR